MKQTTEGKLFSAELGLELWLAEGRLRLVDPATGEQLLRPSAAQEARRVAEAELERLRAEMARLRREQLSANE